MQNILITGGSRGIGASTALKCAQRGYRVILTWNSQPAAAKSVIDRIETEGGKAIALPLDVGDIGSFKHFRSQLEQAMYSHWEDTGLDGLVNNAGYGLFNPIENVTEDQFDSLMNVHLKGPFFLTQTLVPLLRNDSCIINITSATTRVATAGVAPYASFKGGLEVLTRYMAKEFEKRGIRANAVSPGAIQTELGGGLNEEFENLLASQTALGRVGKPEEVASVIAFLLSTDSRWVNAQTIEVAGGYNI